MPRGGILRAAARRGAAGLHPFKLRPRTDVVHRCELCAQLRDVQACTLGGLLRIALWREIGLDNITTLRLGRPLLAHHLPQRVAPVPALPGDDRLVHE